MRQGKPEILLVLEPPDEIACHSMDLGINIFLVYAVITDVQESRLWSFKNTDHRVAQQAKSANRTDFLPSLILSKYIR
jgi:hypothetical protein